MSVTLQSSRRSWALLPRQQLPDYICYRCSVTQSSNNNNRTYATFKERFQPGNKPKNVLMPGFKDGQPVEEQVSIKAPSPYKLAASLCLSRPPMLTRDLSPFEKAYYFYQRRLDKRLALPFTRWQYYKQNTLLYDEYRRKQKGLSKYNSYGPDGWKDELMLGQKPFADEEMEFEDYVRNTITGEEVDAGGVVGEEAGEVVSRKTLDKPLPRISQADIDKDVRSLNRAMSRTLYLLVKRAGREHDVWKFPQADVEGRENLRQTANRGLAEACGVNMNTWRVGNVPIGHYHYLYPSFYKKPADEENLIGKAVFFMKARILAGKPDITNNTANIDDYQWLTKQEIEGVVTRDYWGAIKHIMVDR